MQHLKEVYDASEYDNVEIFCHFPTSPSTSTLHIHARVNGLKAHKVEENTRYDLNDIIACIEKGNPIEGLIFERNPNTTAKEFETRVFDGVTGVHYKIVPNQYRIESGEMHSSSRVEIDKLKDAMQHYFSKEEMDYLYTFEKTINISLSQGKIYLHILSKPLLMIL